MKKLNLSFLLGIAIVALTFSTSLTSAEIPTYVERLKDVCYYKIHGGPYGSPPAFGRAEAIYKNLSPEAQTVTIQLSSIWLGVPRSQAHTFTVEIGGEITDYIPGDLGTIVDFALLVNGSPELTGSIVIPPP